MSDIGKKAIAIGAKNSVTNNSGDTLKGLHPRILFINCDNYSLLGGDQAKSHLACSLISEGWVADSFKYIKKKKRMGKGNQLIKLIDRFSDKFRYIQRLIRLIPGYEIVHIECSSPRIIVRYALPAVLLTRFFGRKIVLYFKSSEAERFLEGSARWFLQILRLADITIVSSRYLQKLVNRTGLKCKRYDYPIDLEKIENRIVSDLQPKVLLCSPLEEGSDVHVAIRAFSLVKQKYPRAEMLIAGDGSKKNILEELVLEMRLQGISFIGYRKIKELPQLLKCCDLYLSSATAAEPSLDLLSAFAAGLPVVCTDADGLMQTVQNSVNALVAPVGDYVALADRVIDLIESSELTRELSERGRVEASRYSWLKMRVDWIRLYDRLVESRLTN